MAPRAAYVYQKRKLSQQSTGLSSPRDADLVLVKNTSGADRARFEILGINTPVITPHRQSRRVPQPRGAFGCGADGGANHWGKFVAAIRDARKAYQTDGTMPDWGSIEALIGAVRPDE